MACARLASSLGKASNSVSQCALASAQNQVQHSAAFVHYSREQSDAWRQPARCCDQAVPQQTSNAVLHSHPIPPVASSAAHVTALRTAAASRLFSQSYSSTASGSPNSYRERRLMAFSPSELFSVVADVDSYEEFVPWCRQSCVTRRLGGGKYEADLVVGFQMFREKYTSVVTVKEPCLVHSEAADSAVFDHLVTRWELKPGPNKTTSWVTFTIDFSFKNVIYAQTASLFFDQVVSKMISAFDKRCEQIFRAQKADKHPS